jgi:hypothetical protein
VVGAVVVEALAGGHELDRGGARQQARHALGAAGAGQHAQGDLGQAALARAPARDAQVRGQRDLQTTAHAVATQRADEQLGRVLHAQQRLVGVQAEVVLELRLGALEHRDVGAGAEELLALAGDDHDFDLLVEARAQDRLVQVAHHLQRVAVGRRAGEREQGDAAARLVADATLGQGLGLGEIGELGHGERGARGRRAFQKPGCPGEGQACAHGCMRAGRRAPAASPD